MSQSSCFGAARGFAAVPSASSMKPEPRRRQRSSPGLHECDVSGTAGGVGFSPQSARRSNRTALVICREGLEASTTPNGLAMKGIDALVAL